MSPSNQHGTTSAHVKESASSSIHLNENKSPDDSKEKRIKEYQKKFGSVHTKYASARNDICVREKNSRMILALTRESIAKDLRKRLYDEASKGMSLAVRDLGKKQMPNCKVVVGRVEQKIESTTKHLFEDLEEELKKAKSKDEKLAVFDRNEYRLRFLSEMILPKAKWYTYVRTCAAMGIEKVYVNFGRTDTSDEHTAIINTSAFLLDDIPPYHAYCTCKLDSKKT